jgi:biotin-(acetyl-CoA carboxylase) ligase
LILLLNTKNRNKIKLKGAIIGIGINLAYLASVPDEIKNFKIKVPKLQNKIKLIKYLIPDFE